MKCQGFIGLLCGHDYQPVFNKEPTGRKITLEEGPASLMRDFFEYDTKRTYVHTICTRCGHKLEQPRSEK